MCGIIAYKGNKNAVEVVFETLKECSKRAESGDCNSHLTKAADVPQHQVMNILDFVKFENYYCQIRHTLQKRLREKISNCSDIAREIGVSRSTVQRMTSVREYWANFQSLFNLCRLLGIRKNEVYHNTRTIKTKNSFPIVFDTKNLVSPAFFRVLGHILGDGGIHVIRNEGKYRAFYVNNEQILLDSFANDTKLVFRNIRVYSRRREKQGDEVWMPTTVGYLLYQILDYEKSPEKRMPVFVMKTNNPTLLCALLQALFDDEGYVYPSRRMVQIALGNKNLLNDVKLIMERIGIRTNRIYKVTPKNRSIMYTFSITSRANISEFARKINFIHSMKKKKLLILLNTYRVP